MKLTDEELKGMDEAIEQFTRKRDKENPCKPALLFWNAKVDCENCLFDECLYDIGDKALEWLIWKISEAILNVVKGKKE